eukprot:15143024-Ditylum_brightwellii.AAC.1
MAPSVLQQTLPSAAFHPNISVSKRREVFEKNSRTAATVIIDINKDLKSASWSSLYRHLQYLSKHRDLILPTLVQSDPTDNQSTPLHTVVWKAPPSLALMLIRLLPADKELS